MYICSLYTERSPGTYVCLYARMYGRLRAPVACIPAWLCMSARARACERRRNTTATARCVTMCLSKCVCACMCIWVYV